MYVLVSRGRGRVWVWGVDIVLVRSVDWCASEASERMLSSSLLSNDRFIVVPSWLSPHTVSLAAWSGATTCAKARFDLCSCQGAPRIAIVLRVHSATSLSAEQ